MPAYYGMIVQLFNSITFLRIGAYLGVPVSIILLVMFIRKNNRDERGWKIFGKASVISFIYLMVIVNVIAKTIGSREFPYNEVGYVFFANTIQWLYDTVAIVEIAAIMIFRNLE